MRFYELFLLYLLRITAMNMPEIQEYPQLEQHGMGTCQFCEHPMDIHTIGIKTNMTGCHDFSDLRCNSCLKSISFNTIVELIEDEIRSYQQDSDGYKEKKQLMSLVRLVPSKILAFSFSFSPKESEALMKSLEIKASGSTKTPGSIKASGSTKAPGSEPYDTSIAFKKILLAPISILAKSLQDSAFSHLYLEIRTLSSGILSSKDSKNKSSYAKQLFSRYYQRTNDSPMKKYLFAPRILLLVGRINEEIAKELAELVFFMINTADDGRNGFLNYVIRNTVPYKSSNLLFELHMINLILNTETLDDATIAQESARYSFRGARYSFRDANPVAFPTEFIKKMIEIFRELKSVHEREFFDNIAPNFTKLVCFTMANLKSSVHNPSIVELSAILQYFKSAPELQNLVQEAEDYVASMLKGCSVLEAVEGARNKLELVAKEDIYYLIGKNSAIRDTRSFPNEFVDAMKKAEIICNKMYLTSGLLDSGRPLYANRADFVAAFNVKISKESCPSSDLMAGYAYYLISMFEHSTLLMDRCRECKNYEKDPEKLQTLEQQHKSYVGRLKAHLKDYSRYFSEFDESIRWFMSTSYSCSVFYALHTYMCDLLSDTISKDIKTKLEFPVRFTPLDTAKIIARLIDVLRHERGMYTEARFSVVLQYILDTQFRMYSSSIAAKDAGSEMVKDSLEFILVRTVFYFLERGFDLARVYNEFFNDRTELYRIVALVKFHHLILREFGHNVETKVQYASFISDKEHYAKTRKIISGKILQISKDFKVGHKNELMGTSGSVDCKKLLNDFVRCFQDEALLSINFPSLLVPAMDQIIIVLGMIFATHLEQEKAKSGNRPRTFMFNERLEKIKAVDNSEIFNKNIEAFQELAP